MSMSGPLGRSLSSFLPVSFLKNVKRVDFPIFKEMAFEWAAYQESSNAKKRTKSMNGGFRKQEMLRITMENEALLKRIKSRRSNIDRKQLDQNEALHKKYLSNICEFPLTLYSNQAKESSISKDRANGTKEQSRLLDANSTAKSNKKFRITSNKTKRERGQVVQSEDSGKFTSISLQKNTMRVMGDVILADVSKETRGTKEKKIVVSFISINKDEKLRVTYPFEECTSSTISNSDENHSNSFPLGFDLDGWDARGVNVLGVVWVDRLTI